MLTTTGFPSPCRDLRFSFFFFQAEDGIRDRNVTGVQTCALPISLGNADDARARRRGERLRSVGGAVVGDEHFAADRGALEELARLAHASRDRRRDRKSVV